MRSAVILMLFLAVAAAGWTGCSSSGTSSGYSGYRSGSTVQSLTGERRLVILESQKWMGTPYRYGGTTREGADCSGFVLSVFAKAGVSLPRTADAMFHTGTPVTLGKILPGDLVFFSDRSVGDGITHVGIYTGQEKFIHSSSSSGVIVSSLTQSYYRTHYAGARKVLK
jgi:cell wall-associated NlpC family hydrolase